jgi:hypothetical protein
MVSTSVSYELGGRSSYELEMSNEKLGICGGV